MSMPGIAKAAHGLSSLQFCFTKHTAAHGKVPQNHGECLQTAAPGFIFDWQHCQLLLFLSKLGASQPEEERRMEARNERCGRNPDRDQLVLGLAYA